MGSDDYCNIVLFCVINEVIVTGGHQNVTLLFLFLDHPAPKGHMSSFPSFGVCHLSSVNCIFHSSHEVLKGLKPNLDEMFIRAIPVKIP